MHERLDEGWHRLSGGWGSLEVHELGATVMSWRPLGRERLFMSSAARPREGQMWHGGIPLCVPWFGRGPGWPVPWMHGLVSRVRWCAEELCAGDDAARAVLRLDASATAALEGASRYPADLGYRLEVSADAARLRLDLEVASPTQEATLEAVFHPYLAVASPDAQITGLGGVAFHDYSDGSDAVEQQTTPVLRTLDRVYSGAPPVRLLDGGLTLALEAEGTGSTVVWNPGPAGDAVPTPEWERFVCVEYGNIAGRAVRVPAGSTHRQSLTLSVAPEPGAH